MANTNRDVKAIIKIDFFMISAIAMPKVLANNNSNEALVDTFETVTFLVRHMINGSGRKYTIPISELATNPVVTIANSGEKLSRK